MNREEIISKIWREEYMSERKDGLDEIVRYLTEPELDIPEGTLEKVADLLRAGQAMRDAIEHAPRVPAYMDSAAKAWDAATKEDKE